MDTFDVLKAISKKKDELVHIGMDEREAMMKAIRDVSGEYHITLHDIEKLTGL